MQQSGKGHIHSYTVLFRKCHFKKKTTFIMKQFHQQAKQHDNSAYRCEHEEGGWLLSCRKCYQGRTAMKKRKATASLDKVSHSFSSPLITVNIVLRLKSCHMMRAWRIRDRHAVTSRAQYENKMWVRVCVIVSKCVCFCPIRQQRNSRAFKRKWSHQCPQMCLFKDINVGKIMCFKM